MKAVLFGTTAVVIAAGFSAPAFAASASGASAPAEVSEVIVTGTRQTGVKAANSAAPVELVGAAALKRVGQPDLIQALSQNLPSFNAQGYGADTAQLTLSAALRGLSPNDTLVLVDGKRRHGTGNLAVDTGSPYTGAAAADLSFIPVGAIDHVEVLQDGAAAQYGTDAIAGVVNVILKNTASGGQITATGGSYYKGDGTTAAWSVNKGFALGDKGFVNVTAEERYHEFSQRGGEDVRYFNPDGSVKSTLGAIDAAGITSAIPGFPRVNKIYGDPQYNIYDLFYNAGYDLGGGVQFYSFGSFGHRGAQAYENFRPPSKITGYEESATGVVGGGALVVPYPHGFQPKEQLTEDDYSITAGVKGDVSGIHWDLGTTYGEDHDTIQTVDSGNILLFAALQSVSKTPIQPESNYFDGRFINTEWTTTLDLSRDFEVGLASPLNVAAGAEVRENTFHIDSGSPDSVFGSGAASYPGFASTDAGTHRRTNYAGYVDFAVDPIKGLHTDLAGRYESYTDFGDAFVYKFTARYDFNPMFAIRGTISDGFRAPTLAEEYYSATNVAPTYAIVQLPPNSLAAADAGFSKLHPEKSTNYSVGFVAHPIDRLQVSLDLYEIDIQKRIINSGFIFGTNGPTVVSQGVLNAIAAHGNVLEPGLSYTGIEIFSNAGNTKTQGVELTANYASDFAGYGHVDWSAGFNFNETTVTKLTGLPSVVANPAQGQTQLLTPNALTALTNSVPKFKVILGAYWTMDKLSVNLRETIYGPSSQAVSFNGSGSGSGATVVHISTTPITDLDVGYKVTDKIKIDVGANNLLDQKAPTIPLLGGSPVDGNHVDGEPDQWTPWGINGGYYYGRVTYSF